MTSLLARAQVFCLGTTEVPFLSILNMAFKENVEPVGSPSSTTRLCVAFGQVTFP